MVSTRPRTRKHFPRMKVRGGRRRHYRRQYQLMETWRWYTDHAVDFEKVVQVAEEVFAEMSKTMESMSRAIEEFALTFANAEAVGSTHTNGEEHELG